ncbi:hemerythrin domain-containing protein [Mesorhizobium waimense]|uniref:hemerythrin domain-containing protein n=1 Tax=Mesorhizobium waimense TaxID=1300307 RepID=UPI00315D59C3
MRESDVPGPARLGGDSGRCDDRRRIGKTEALRRALESINNGLPNVDRLKCLGIGNAGRSLLRDVHRFEETVIFPAYEACLTSAEANLASTSRLLVEHVEDQCFADEVAETLLAIGHGGPIDKAEAVGFMLRGFFKGLRRHIAIEEEHVPPRLGVRDVGSVT